MWIKLSASTVLVLRGWERKEGGREGGKEGSENDCAIKKKILLSRFSSRKCHLK